MANLIFKSFRARITLALIISMLFALAMSSMLIYKYAVDLRFEELRNRLMVVAQAVALTIDADTLTQVPLNREGINSPQYAEIVKKMKEIKNVNVPIKYIYTLAKTEEPGIWQFIVDPNPGMERAGKGLATAYPGDRYNASRFPQMMEAYNGPSADKKLEIDEWGVTLSGYAPVRDRQAKVVAIVGVDVMADNVYQARKDVRNWLVLVLGMGIVLSLALGILISQRITRPVAELVEGTRRISKGDLGYKARILGNDEIGELAASFNQMANSLAESKEKLVNYFYYTVQSFVRIMEAKDPYTRGHSERVAEYAGNIALRLGLPRDKVELLKETALLHDIGKLEIHQDILNKKGKLTDEEWEVLRRHPAAGEDMMRPIMLSEEMLRVIGSHHERYDSRGYPEGISGENINILAAIVSVADAYDAMTSQRAYRPALSRDRAVEELKKNSGSQFNPRVVEAFLRVLEDEPLTV